LCDPNSHGEFHWRFSSPLFGARLTYAFDTIQMSEELPMPPTPDPADSNDSIPPSVQAPEITQAITQTLRTAEQLLGAVEQAVIATDLNGIIFYWNKFAERLYGWTDLEVIGRNILDVTPSDYVSAHASEIMEKLMAGERWSGELLVKRRDGSIFPAQVSDTPIHNDDGELIGIVGLSHDISERKRIDLELREQNEVIETVNRIGQILSAELDLQKLVQAVTDAATELSGARFGSFFYNVYNESGEAYMLYTLSGVPLEHFAHFPMPRATDLFGPTFRGEGILRIVDVKKDPRYGRNSPYYGMPPGHLPVTSYLAVPVTSSSGTVLGGLFFGHPEPGVFTERTERIMEGLAAQSAIAMDNARLYQAAQKEIAERRRTELELQKAKEDAVDASNAKDLFLAMLSHELRTPLTPVLASVHVLQLDPNLPDDLRPFVDVIHRNIELEARLIDDLLDLTRITKGTLQLNIEPVDVHSLIRNAIEISSADIERKRLHLDVDLHANKQHLHGDPARLQQVFWNLIKNAVKFTPEEGTIAIISESDHQSHMRITIADSGIGIPPDILPHIFNAFEQGEQRINRQYGGLGLGLAISKKIIDLHNGQINATSAGPGKGAVFVVELVGVL
jgi:PAS domain S-box-containing protein